MKLEGATVSDYDFLKDSHLEAEDAARDALGSDQYTAGYRTGYDYPLDQLIPLVTGDADGLPGVAAAPDDGEAADPLTSREREIAALVAGGLSNREIAGRLVISKRTVDAHVDHIYTKLGISSRVQLANWLSAGGSSESQ
jgi:DNA-binding CsgD family transcriptional regulator